MMIDAFSTPTHIAPQGAFSVVAPFIGDVLGGALRSAYDDRLELPDDLLALLERLDRVD